LTSDVRVIHPSSPGAPRAPTSVIAGRAPSAPQHSHAGHRGPMEMRGDSARLGTMPRHVRLPRPIGARNDRVSLAHETLSVIARSRRAAEAISRQPPTHLKSRSDAGWLGRTLAAREIATPYRARNDRRGSPRAPHARHCKARPRPYVCHCESRSRRAEAISRLAPRPMDVRGEGVRLGTRLAAREIATPYRARNDRKEFAGCSY
jgi:hypothetical protein